MEVVSALEKLPKSDIWVVLSTQYAINICLWRKVKKGKDQNYESQQKLEKFHRLDWSKLPIMKLLL